LKVLKLRSTG